MKAFGLALLGILFLSLTQSAQAGTFEFGSGEEEESAVTCTMFQRQVGTEIRLAIKLEIKPGYHLYHTELGPKDAVGQAMKIIPSGKGITWGAPVLPTPKKYETPSLTPGKGMTWIYGHEGTIVIHLTGQLAAGADPSSVKVNITGLACKEDCVPLDETLTSQGAGSDALFAPMASKR